MRNAGIIVNVSPNNNLRYAKDTVFEAENIDDLQRIIPNVYMACLNYGLSINGDKTAFLVFTKRSHNKYCLTHYCSLKHRACAKIQIS